MNTRLSSSGRRQFLRSAATLASGLGLLPRPRAWCGVNVRVTNRSDAEPLLRRTYRRGWPLNGRRR